MEPTYTDCNFRTWRAQCKLGERILLALVAADNAARGILW
jgi:hypothetical protein